MGRISFLQRFIGLLFLTAIFASPSLYADLDEFGREIEEEQEKGPDDRDSTKKDDPETKTNEGYGSLFEGILYLLVIWTEFNLTTYYPPFPYAESDFSTEPEPYFAANALIDGSSPRHFERMRGTIRTSGGVFLEGGDQGATAAISASGMIFGLLGPDFEYRWWGDASGNLHFFRLGAVLPLMQTDPITIGIPMAAAFYVGAFDLVGFAIGGVFQSYPIRPLSFEIRGGAIIAPELILGEIGGSISVYANRFEFFTGYYGLIHGGRVIHTFDFGIGINF